MPNPKPLVLNGIKVSRIFTFKSWHDNDFIGIEDENKQTYRIKVTEFAQLLSHLEFFVTRARIHQYLTIKPIKTVLIQFYNVDEQEDNRTKNEVILKNG